MNKLGGGGLFVLGILIVLLGVIAQSDILTWLLDIIGFVIIIAGVIVVIMGLIKIFSGGQKGANDY